LSIIDFATSSSTQEPTQGKGLQIALPCFPLLSILDDDATELIAYPRKQEIHASFCSPDAGNSQGAAPKATAELRKDDGQTRTQFLGMLIYRQLRVPIPQSMTRKTPQARRNRSGQQE